tara:strand:+ start:82 stop:564 length:483 start_codon:yes stop_codon:yes gene_type:complete
MGEVEEGFADMAELESYGISSSNICSLLVGSDDGSMDGSSDGDDICDYTTDPNNVIPAFLCISTCEIPDCGAHINPISVLTEGAFTSCTDTLLSMIESNAELSAMGEDLWEYLCSFGEDRRRLTTKGGAKHAPSPALQLKLPSLQRAVAKAVAAVRNLAK